MLIVGVAVVLGVIALKMPSKKVSSKVEPREIARPSEASPIQEIPEGESKAYDSKAYKDEITQMRAQFAARTMLGLKSLDLKEESGLVRIPFQLIPSKVWCQGGDLDTMKYASRDLGANEILISLEPSSGGKGDSLRTSVAALYKGIEHTFKLQPGNGTQSYGLYICSDSKNGTSCKDKIVKTHAEISKEASLANDAAKKDYLFYYQHVLLARNNLEVYRSDDTSDEFKKSIETYLNEQKDISSSEIQTAWKIASVMRSTSPDVKDDRLQLTLPYNDPRCMDPGK